EDTRHVVVVNYADRPAQARLPLPWDDLRGGHHRLTDLLTDRTYDRDGDELTGPGLFVALDAWDAHVLSAPARETS
ncbi:alpha-amylase, partial [Streptomyces rochei]